MHYYLGVLFAFKGRAWVKCYFLCERLQIGHWFTVAFDNTRLWRRRATISVLTSFFAMIVDSDSNFVLVLDSLKCVFAAVWHFDSYNIRVTCASLHDISRRRKVGVKGSFQAITGVSSAVHYMTTRTFVHLFRRRTHFVTGQIWRHFQHIPVKYNILKVPHQNLEFRFRSPKLSKSLFGNWYNLKKTSSS